VAHTQTTRAFSFWVDPEDPSRGQVTWLLPGLDLLNTRAGGALNAARVTAGSAAAGDAAVQLRALGRVAAGQELFWAYHAAEEPRIDTSLLLYGMVNGSDTRLAGLDMAECAPPPVAKGLGRLAALSGAARSPTQVERGEPLRGHAGGR
jgi:hypothetical protein